MPCRPETTTTILHANVVAGAEAFASGTTHVSTTAGRRGGHRLSMLLLLLVMVGMWWWTPAAVVAVHGLSLSSLSSFDHGEVALLIKTRETFKLADVQFLTARILLLSLLDDNEVEPKAAARTTSWSTCERLALDARTGSSLLRLGQRGGGERGDLVVRDSEEYDDDPDNNDGTSTTKVAAAVAVAVAASSSLANGPFADQIDWIGRVLVAEESSTAVSLVDAIGRQSATWALDRPWTLRYLSMTSSSSSSSCSDSNSRNSINEKRMLCAVAQSIQSPRAALLEDDQTARLMIVRVVGDAAANDNNNDDDDPAESFFLTQQLLTTTTTMAQNPGTTQRQAFRQQWASRPFPYSSAINYDIAEMTMAMLLHGRRKEGTRSSNNDGTSIVVDTPNIRLLDPTCGSGTFLAVAMKQQGMMVSTLWVEGRDSNPACIDGTRRNLEFMFGPAAVSSSTCRLVVRDSAKTAIATAATQHNNDEHDDDRINGNHHHHPTGKFNCLVCNLPWGLNTKSYVNENIRILAAVRTELETGARCVVIWKADPNDELLLGKSLLRADLERIGYRTIDQAHVPPQDFRLPTSNKVGGASGGGPPNKKKQQLQPPTNHGRSCCVVSVLETI